MFMDCEWGWIFKNNEKLLYVKCIKSAALSMWLDFIPKALSNFEGGPLKILVDTAGCETNMGYNEEVNTLYSCIKSFGVERGVICVVVSDNFYEMKEKVINEFAIINKQPFYLKSFLNLTDAEKWLVNYSFSQNDEKFSTPLPSISA